MEFENKESNFNRPPISRREKSRFPVSPKILCHVFPFSVVFSSHLIIEHVGVSLHSLLPNLLGKKLSRIFLIFPPDEKVKFPNTKPNSMKVYDISTSVGFWFKWSERISMNETNPKIPENVTLQLRGQIIYLEKWNKFFFPGTPVIENIDSIASLGLFINEFSMHDFSRDLMVAGTQQKVELKLASEQEHDKTCKLEDSLIKLKQEMDRTRQLLFEIIPDQTALIFAEGEIPRSTFKVLDTVSILVSDIVKFTTVCSGMKPMEVVTTLNAMYSRFDALIEKHHVCKVETIGDAYMVVSYNFENTQYSTSNICDMALEMIEAIKDIKEPTTGSHFTVRIGINTGTVVTGIIGIKIPKYCIFGEAVKIAVLLESESIPMKIKISQSTLDLLTPLYLANETASIPFNEKSNIKTYWLLSKNQQK